MEDTLSKIQNEPLVLFLVIVGAIALAAVFLIPVFLKYIKSSKHNFAQQKLPVKINLNIKSKIKSPKYIVISLLTVVLVAGIGYATYDFFLAPIRIVKASQIKLERGSAIKQIQGEKLKRNQRYTIAFLDIRSSEEYAKEHIKGSASIPVALIADRDLKVNLDIAIYSTAAKKEEARRTAEIIWKKAVTTKGIYSGKIGKLYVISDGFEGLKGAGLETESGIWD